MTKKCQSKSPTLIGWVDYLDIWAKSKVSKNCSLDILDTPLKLHARVLPYKRSSASFQDGACLSA